jgi:hypothetical protein
VGHVQQRSVSSIPEKLLIDVPLDGPTCGDSAQIGTRKSPSVRRGAAGLPTLVFHNGTSRDTDRAFAGIATVPNPVRKHDEFRC